MTGYGRGEVSRKGIRCTVEIKSYNHRYRDVVIKLPPILSPWENELRNYILKCNFRGRWEIWVNWEESGGAENIRINTERARKYLDAYKILQKELHLKNDLTLSFIASLPEIISPENSSVVPKTVQDILYRAVDDSMVMLQARKEEEGKHLLKDISSRLKILLELVDKTNQRAPQVVENYRQKLSQRMKQFTRGLALEESRLAMEVALFAERSDITEELIRLKAHGKKIRECLKRNEPVGRELDFILQEMQKEINTVGAKSSDVEISQLVIAMKTEVEKIREQVQNIE